MQARPAGAHGHQVLRREAGRRVRGPVLQGAVARWRARPRLVATAVIGAPRCNQMQHRAGQLQDCP